jgi:hypothetical protein
VGVVLKTVGSSRVLKRTRTGARAFEDSDRCTGPRAAQATRRSKASPGTRYPGTGTSRPGNGYGQIVSCRVFYCVRGSLGDLLKQALHGSEAGFTRQRNRLYTAAKQALHGSEAGFARQQNRLCTAARQALHGSKTGFARQRGRLYTAARQALHGRATGFARQGSPLDELLGAIGVRPGVEQPQVLPARPASAVARAFLGKRAELAGGLRGGWRAERWLAG